LEALARFRRGEGELAEDPGQGLHEKFWTSAKMAVSATGCVFLLLVAISTATEVFFIPADDDWIEFKGKVDSYDIIERQSNSGRFGSHAVHGHAGFFLPEQDVRFTVTDRNPDYDYLVASSWNGRDVTVRVARNDYERAMREIDERGARDTPFSRQHQLEVFETRIWEMHWQGNEVVNLDANIRAASEGWAIRLIVVLAFCAATFWSGMAAFRNWQRWSGSHTSRP
jgi:hypothetical protein